MKNLLAGIMMLVGVQAFAYVEDYTYVRYGQWTPIAYCGGETKLECEGGWNAKEENRCHVYFRDSYGCPNIKMYVDRSFEPTWATSYVRTQGELYVDYSKINKLGADNFRIYMYNNSTGTYRGIKYQFDY